MTEAFEAEEALASGVAKEAPSGLGTPVAAVFMTCPTTGVIVAAGQLSTPEGSASRSFLEGRFRCCADQRVAAVAVIPFVQRVRIAPTPPAPVESTDRPPCAANPTLHQAGRGEPGTGAARLQ